MPQMRHSRERHGGAGNTGRRHYFRRWELLLSIVLRLAAADPCCGGEFDVPAPMTQMPYTLLLVTDLLASSDNLPWDVIRLKPTPQSPTAAEPSSSPLVLCGAGSAMPPKWLSFGDVPIASFNETNGIRVDDWNSFSAYDASFVAPSSPQLPPSPPSPMPPPPSPPPAPPRPPRGPSEEPPYTILDWREWRHAPGPAIRLRNGQSLTIRSTAFYMEDMDGAVTGGALLQLTFGLIQVDPGATLLLEDITALLGCMQIQVLLLELCRDPDAWPYNPGVVIGDGAIRIANLSSTAPGPDGSPGAGGRVHWRNVTLLCPDLGFVKPLYCAARSVADGQELGAVARWALGKEQTNERSAVFLSLTGDVFALPADGSWVQVALRPGQQLVLRGDPARTTTLDLSGIAEAWTLPLPPSNSNSGVLTSRRGLQILMYDLHLVNLPYPTQPNGSMSLLALSLASVRILRGLLMRRGELPQLSVIRSTIVVPDQELAFLAAAADRGNSSDVWPGMPSGGFDITVTSKEVSSDGSISRMVVQQLKLAMEVLLLNCTLLSASSYEQLPGAVPLRPESRLWLPGLLASRDPETVAQWGLGGLAAFPGLQQALVSLSSCNSLSSSAGYNPIRLIWGPDDHSVPPLDSSAASGSSAAITLSFANSSGAAMETPAAAAAACVVDGSPTANPLLPPEGRGRVFSDLQGAISRVVLMRPITLRNLVLYNLAPGGAYPDDVDRTAGGAPPQLRPSDAAWANSSLPLWFFNFSRSSSDAAPLVLENVTLVVPEREWRAMVAAMLQVHTSQAFLAAHQRPKLPPSTLQPPQHSSRRATAQLGAEPPPESPQRPMQEQRPHPPMAPALPWPQEPPCPPPTPPANNGVTSPGEIDAATSAGSEPIANNGQPGKPSSSLTVGSSLPPSLPALSFVATGPPPLLPSPPQLPAQPPPPPPPPPPSSPPSSSLRPQPPQAPLSTPPSASEPPVAPSQPNPPDMPPLPPQPPLLPPFPPSPPSPPPPPPYADTTRSALMAFAAASRVLSYNYNAGELVLATASHYGWYGTNVTIMSELPEDAPRSAKLLSYSQLALPYDDLADLALDVAGDVFGTLRQSLGAGALPLGSLSDPATETMTTPPPPPTKSAPVGSGRPGSLDAGTGSSSGTDPWVAPAPVSSSPNNSVTTSNRRRVIVAASLAAVGGALLLLTAVLTGAVLVRRRRRRRRRYGRNGSSGEPSSGSSIWGRTSAWLYQNPAFGRHKPPVAAEGRSPGPSGDVSAGKVKVVCIADDGTGHVAIAAASAATTSGACAGAGAGSATTSEAATTVNAAAGFQLSSGMTTSGMDSTRTGASLAELHRGAFETAATTTPLPSSALSAQANRMALTLALARSMASRDRQQNPELVAAAAGGAAAAAAGPLRASKYAVRAVMRPPASSSGGDGGNGNDLGEEMRQQQWHAATQAETDTDGAAAAATAEPPHVDDELFLNEFNTYFLTVSRDRGQGQQPAARRLSGGEGDTDTVEALLQLNPSQVPHSRERWRQGPRSLTDAIKAVQDELSDSELHLDALIGRGSYGVVYRGMWRGLPVAVKTLVVSQELVGREGRARQQAALEAAISMALAHPNVVVTYSYKVKVLVQSPSMLVSGATAPSDEQDVQIDRDVAVCGGPLEQSDVSKLYIIQEYCNGRTLREALDLGIAGCVLSGGAPRVLALRLALDVARGMQHIHSCRIVHGDLKTENVLLAWSPRATNLEQQPYQQLTAKVADFGLSTLLPEGATHASGQFKGTPAYLAPEVALTGLMSPRADVWSFGLMLIELYFGCSLSAVISVWASILKNPKGNPHHHLHTATLLRETLAAITDLPYSELVGKCVSLEPRQRPGFDEIVAVLASQL